MLQKANGIFGGISWSRVIFAGNWYLLAVFNDNFQESIVTRRKFVFGNSTALEAHQRKTIICKQSWSRIVRNVIWGGSEHQK